MYKIEIHPLIYQIINVFDCCGMWERYSRFATVFGVNLIKLIYSVVYGSYVMSIAIGCYSKRDDKDELLLLAVVGVLSGVLLVKQNYVLWKHKEITIFLHELSENSIADENEFIKIDKKINFFMKFVRYYLYMNTLGNSLFMISGLPIFRREKMLPLNIWLPLDWKNNGIHYWIAYSICFTCLILSWLNSLLTVLVWYLMINCSIKYEILGSQLRNIGITRTTNAPVAIDRGSNGEKQKLLLQDFIELIKSHQHIRKYSS